MQDPSFLDEAQLIDVREPEEVYSSFIPALADFFLKDFSDFKSLKSQVFSSIGMVLLGVLK